MRRILILIGIALLLSTNLCNAININNYNISLSALSVIDQFPSNSIQCIFQDKEGYLWFGTPDGLCRYDGYKVMTFRSNIENPNLLVSNEITCMAESHDSKLWIGTKKGVSILDLDTYEIIHFHHSQIKNSPIRAIKVLSDSSILVGTEEMLYRYKGDEEPELLSTKAKGLPVDGNVNSIYEDNIGDIWICYWKEGLYRYKKSGEVVGYPQLGTLNNPFKVFQDKDNQYWIATWGDGLYRFYPTRNKEMMYESIHVCNRDNNTQENTIFSIAQDNQQGYIWAVSLSGVYAIQVNNDNTIKQLDVSPLFSGTNNIFSEIYKDREGTIWIAAFNEGAFKLTFDKTKIETNRLEYINSTLNLTPNITALYEDTDGLLWFNQNRYGLCILDTKTDEIRTLGELENLQSFKGLKHISAFQSILNGNKILMGDRYDGILYEVNNDRKNIYVNREFNLKDIYPYREVEIISLFSDSKNNIWIGTTNGTYMKEYQSDTIKFLENGLRYFDDITEDLHGDVWFASGDNGVFHSKLIVESDSTYYRFTKHKQINKLINKDHHTSAILADSQGLIWMGTLEGGLYTIDPLTNEINDLSKKNHPKGEAIQNILKDKYGKIWISTSKRIIEYNSHNGASIDYTKEDGIEVDSYFKGACFYNQVKGKIYYGGNKGISIFSASQDDDLNVYNNDVIITEVKSQSQSIFNKKNQYKEDKINKSIQIGAYDNNIEIDFSSLDYIHANKILYAYKMEGVDKDWVITDRQYAFYNKLHKGQNIFLVKSTDHNKLWNDDVTTYMIYKKPAFYETWWAYIFYIVVVSGIIIAVFRFVKYRVDIKNELKIAHIEKEKTEELTQTKLQYFTNISHDFLTPLTIISCLIDDIEISSDKRISQFKDVRYNIDRLSRLLQQILDFKRLEQSQMTLQVSFQDISDYINKMLHDNFVPLALQSKISLVFDSTPSQISGLFDVNQLDKALYNILSNALKFTDNGGRVSVNLNQYEKDSNLYLSIAIQDTGCGIQPNELNKIFERFYTSNKRSIKGGTNGIGLSIAYDLIHLHKGNIEVESEPNKGSTFTIHIPINKEAYSEEEILQVNSDILDLGRDDLDAFTEIKEDISNDLNNDISILIVEDNEEILYLIKKVLSRKYNVLTATNGVTALEIVNSNDIDLVISDVMMPEMDGLELCRAIKSSIETSHIPVILLTAKNRTEDRIDCYKAGANSYIRKPFELKVLDARVENFIIQKKNKQKEFKQNESIKIEILEYPSMDEMFLSDIVKIVEDHLAESEFNVDIFASMTNLSKSTLYRKIKTITGLSPNEFIRNIRLKHACQMLAGSSMNVSEVAYAVGFTDPRYFATCFRNEFGKTPSEYQKER